MEINTGLWRLIGRGLQPVLKVASLATTPIKRKREPVQLPTRVDEVQETSQEEVEKAIRTLLVKKREWREITCQERSQMLEQCLEKVRDVAKKAAELAVKAHGSFGTGIGEELAFWVPIAMAFIEYKHSMDCHGKPKPFHLQKQDNQYIADVFPQGIFAALFGDLRVEVWISPGKEPTQGRIYREKEQEQENSDGGLSLVLGAGNHINVVILDVLHKLICDDEVVLVKMNPQNAFLGLYIIEALAPFFEKDYVKLVYGGTQQGSYLTHHTSIDSIHLTGSVQTFNSIVYGNPASPGKDAIPALQKKVTAELGCFTPAIIVPGTWSEGEMEYVAASIVSGLINNSSHNCCALECVITMQSWPLREQFIEILTKKLDKQQRQVAWYRGSQERFDNFLKQYPDALLLGRTKYPKQTLPWAFVPNLTPESANTEQENWCGVLQEICLSGSDASDFMTNAVEFCNNKCWGTLSCCLMIDPLTQNEHNTAFKKAICGLRYGNITINAPSIFNFLPAASWGAFPGNQMWDIGSGNCAVHNSLLFDYPEKSVMYCPWILQPLPTWADISNKKEIILAFLAFAQRPSLFTLIAIVPSLLRASAS